MWDRKDARRSFAFVASRTTEKKQLKVKAGLAEHLTRLWRYGLVLSGNRDATEDLVQAASNAGV